MKDESTQDSYFIKLTGKASIGEPLEIGSNFGVAIEGSITSKTETDNDDGSHSHYFKFEPVLVTVINNKGKSIKAKDVRGRSKQLRSAIWKEWSALSTNEEFDTYYNKRMLDIIKEVTEL
jgi:hypothetical protein